ncbi:MAG: hypothetical protein JXQ73_30240 [Phycisphaerae bacterium]|nr:hypothetical protein [Phycisphaerae bacterium]
MARRSGPLFAVGILGLLLVGWVGQFQPDGPEVVLKGPGLIVIARTEIYGELERPPVPFEHEQHVKALQGEGCTACHVQEDGNLVMAFVRAEDTTDDVLDAYHAKCTTCHTERSQAGQTAGPVTCGGCHVRGVTHVSSRRPAGLDLVLHKRHADAYGGEEKCDDCHKAKDKKAVRLIYEMGAKLKGLPLKDAAHMACVGCHYRRAQAGENTGPLACSDCHHKHAESDWLERPKALPEGYRLMRDQKDVVTIYVGKEAARFDPVTFDHKTHEGVVGTCRGCHHNTVQGCGTCHTLRGSAEGGNVKLAKAHHEPFSARSCVGCHETQQIRSLACAGCHGADPIGFAPPEGSCLDCHGERPPVIENVPKPPETDVAIENVFPRRGNDVYGPVAFSHSKHVAALRKHMKEDQSHRLAARFHHAQPVLCTACHHHSPEARADAKPPRCTTCHGTSFDLEHLERPTTPGAYHQQCIGCHERMDARKDGKRLVCTDCHAKLTDSTKEAP